MVSAAGDSARPSARGHQRAAGHGANYPAVVRNVICITKGDSSQIKSAE
jgi:hypothetical protein